MDLVRELKTVIDTLQKADIDFALCGGLAMAVYAFPRATLDIDLLMLSGSLDKTKEALADAGYSIDSGWLNFKGGRVKIYRLGKVVLPEQEMLVLDILPVTPDLEDVWKGRKMIAWENGEIPVVSPAGLITMKRIRGSGQDLDDIAKLEMLKDED